MRALAIAAGFATAVSTPAGTLALMAGLTLATAALTARIIRSARRTAR